MAKGVHCINMLTAKEYQAAIAAIKLVRGDEIKNAYLEGYMDGYKDCQHRYKGGFVEDDLTAWDKSQAKALSDSKGGSE